jgi:hypothetical protein
VQTLVAEILAAWRRAERLSHELPEGSPDRDAAVAACERLKQVYRDLTIAGLTGPPTETDTRNVLAEIAKDLSPAS